MKQKKSIVFYIINNAQNPLKQLLYFWCKCQLYLLYFYCIIITTTKQKAAGTATNLPTAPNKKTLKGCPNYNTGKGTKQ